MTTEVAPLDRARRMLRAAEAVRDSTREQSRRWPSYSRVADLMDRIAKETDLLIVDIEHLTTFGPKEIHVAVQHTGTVTVTRPDAEPETFERAWSAVVDGGALEVRATPGDYDFGLDYVVVKSYGPAGWLECTRSAPDAHR